MQTLTSLFAAAVTADRLREAETARRANAAAALPVVPRQPVRRVRAAVVRLTARLRSTPA
jgi:hypothetical protein